jgi:hypothetical protein
MKTEKLAQKRTEILEDTINHYNINNRCVGLSGCYYNPKTVNKEGKSEGCAIGRLISKRLSLKMDKTGGDGDIGNPKLFTLLPKKLQVLGIGFLIMLQNLHDVSVNWNKSGLSSEGEVVVRNIRERFDLIH